MSVNIVVIGAGGHGKVVADILVAAGKHVVGFVDAKKLPGSSILGLPVLGGDDWLREHPGTVVALGIGDNFARQRVAEECSAAGIEVITAVHPAATISPSAKIGAGTVVMAGAVVNPDAEIGRGVILNTGAVVEHDCKVGDYAHLSPNSAMGGTSKLGALSHLGMCAAIINNVAVGSRSVIGAGAVVVRDIPDGKVAVGVPARILRPVELKAEGQGIS